MDAEKIVSIAMKEGFDEAVVNISEASEKYLKIANSKIDSVVDKRGISGSLFITKKNRVFFTNIEKVDEAHVKSKIKLAKSMVERLPPKEDYYGIAYGPFKYGKSSGYDKEIKEREELVSEFAESSIEGAISQKGTERSKVYGTVYTEYIKSELVSSGNVHAREDRTVLRMSMRQINGGTSFQDFALSRDAKGIDPYEFGKRVGEMTKSVSGVGRIKSGNYDIVYAQSPGGALLSNINTMATIGSIETGSPLKGRMGKAVAAAGVSIYDDRTRRDSVEHSEYDDEGHPTQKTGIIVNGKLRSYLHNTSTAIKYMAESTGNAGLVEPSAGQMVLTHKKRRKDLEELIREVKRGILITNTWYTRFSDYLAGNFSTVPRDLAVYIEDGERKFQIRQGDAESMVGIRISENILRMLQNMELAADDTKQSTSWDSEGASYFMPSVLVRDSQVSTA
jgi:PmbA protein